MILVVSRKEPARFAYLKHVFASEAVDVILDRRLEERRQSPQPVAVERRRGDRRVRLPTTEFERFGWSIVRR